VRLPPNAIERLGIADLQQKALLHAYLQQAVRQAFAEGGHSAFAASERVTAYHEAGHAVLYALAGIALKQVWIKCVKTDGAATWIGECEADVSWQINEHTLPTEDLRIAEIVLAGWLSEWMFTPDELRAGSSLDEAVLAGVICSGVAHKIGSRPADVLTTAMDGVIASLRAHQVDVQMIPAALMRCRRLSGPQLTSRLPKVRHDQ
jgi:hypothetical protein